MKLLPRILTITILVCLSASASAREVFAIKGTKLRSSKAAFLKLYPKAKCTPGKPAVLPRCTSNDDTFGDLPVDRIEIDVWENTIVSVGATMITENKEKSLQYCKNWISKLSLKYGIPAEADKLLNYQKDSSATITTWNTPEKDTLTVSCSRSIDHQLNKEYFQATAMLTSSEIFNFIQKSMQKTYSNEVKDL